MPNQRRIGVILGYTNIATKNLVNLAYTPMLLTFIGQADYGVFQTSNSFIFTLTILSFGFSGAYIRFYMQRKVQGDEAGIRSLNWLYILLYSVVCLVVLMLGLLFAANVDHVFSGSFTSDEVELAGTLMTIMVFNVAVILFSTVFDAYIMAHEQFFFQQTRQLFTTLATPFLAFGLLSLGMGAVGVALAQLSVNATLLVLNAFFAIKTLKMRFAIGFDSKLLKSIAVFSSWIFINQVCELANQTLPNIFLGALSGAVAVSVFAISIQIRSVFYSLSTTMSSVFIPEVNRIVASSNDNTVLTKLMTKVGRYQSILYFYVLGGFVLLGQFFISAWAGTGFVDAYWLIIAMAAPLFIPLIQNTGLEIQKAKNKHKARSLVYLVMAVFNVAITVVLVPYIGYWAPAIGYITYVIVGCGVFMNWYYQTHIGLNMFYFWRRIIPVVAVAIAATVLSLLGTSFLPVDSWFSFIGWGLTYSVLYGLLSIAFSLTKKERHTLLTKFHIVK